MLKNIVTLKSMLGVTHPGCEFMHDLYITEVYRPGTMFLPLMVWNYLDSYLHGRQGSSPIFVY